MSLSLFLHGASDLEVCEVSLVESLNVGRPVDEFSLDPVQAHARLVQLRADLRHRAACFGDLQQRVLRPSLALIGCSAKFLA